MKKQIKLKTEKEFKDLLSQGYKVVNTYSRLAWSKKEDSEGFDYNYGYIFLEKNDEQLVVDTSNLGIFAMQYNQVADIDGNFFDKVLNQTVKADIEMYTYDYFSQRHTPCVHFEKIEIIQNKQIIQYLKAFVKNKIETYARNNIGRNLFNLFSDVIVVYENEKGIQCQIFDKELTTLKHINNLRNDAQNYKSCYAFSFFQIYNRGKKSEFDADFLVGCILSDVKNEKTISFNLTSLIQDKDTIQTNHAREYIRSCQKIFDKSITKTSIQSLMHISILHPLYTPMPWLYFAVLYPFNYTKPQNNFINISEFFLFGISKNVNEQDSIYYNSISKNGKGSAVIQFDFINDKKINYQLRFDVSFGEQFLHIDFGSQEGKKMSKFLSHVPVDMELIKKFSHRLFISIMSSGFYDPEFAGILKYKIKNIAEIIKKYNELSEPLKIIHRVDEQVKWLEENNLFDEFVFIFKNNISTDMKKYYKITNKFHGLFVRDDQKKIQTTFGGLMVLARKYKGSNQKTYFIEHFLKAK